MVRNQELLQAVRSSAAIEEAVQVNPQLVLIVNIECVDQPLHEVAHAGQVGGDACWAAIASHVQNRSADELKAHAQYYLMSLQSRSPELARAPTPVIWTAEENAYFEAQLAVVDEGSPQRFATIASGLPDKSEDDVRAWYEKLLGDLLEIERGARA